MQRVIVSVATVALAIAFVRPLVGTVRADEIAPTVDALLDAIKVAQGDVPANETRVVVRSTDGVSELETTHRLGRDRRTDFVRESFHVADGTFGGVRWRQNANGEVVREGVAIEPPLVRNVARVHSPIDGYALSQIGPDGLGTIEYVDPKTNFIVRRDVIDDDGTSITEFSDFRRDNGYTRALAWTTTRGSRITIARLQDDRFGNVRSSDVAIPATNASLLSFPAGASRVDLPVTYASDYFVARVDINGRGLDFVIDTGSSGIALDARVAQELGLVSYTGPNKSGVQCEYDARQAIVPRLLVGPLEMHDVVIETVPGTPLRAKGLHAVGLLGYDFIAALGLELNYRTRTVVAFAPGSAPPRPNGAVAVPLRFDGFVPRVDVTVDGTSGDRFIFDTGFEGTIMITDDFVRRHPSARRPFWDVALTDRKFYGVCGGSDIHLAHLDGVSFASFEYGGLDGFREGPAGYDGLVGSHMVRDADLYLDYANARMFLTRGDAAR